MNLEQSYLSGRKNEYYYLVSVEKIAYKEFGKTYFVAIYSNGFEEFQHEYLLGESIHTIISNIQ